MYLLSWLGALCTKTNVRDQSRDQCPLHNIKARLLEWTCKDCIPCPDTTTNMYCQSLITALVGFRWKLGSVETSAKQKCWLWYLEQEYLSRYKPPKTMITDIGTEELGKGISEQIGVQIRHFTPHHTEEGGGIPLYLKIMGFFSN